MWFKAFFLLAVAYWAQAQQLIPVDFAENINDPEAWKARIVSGWEAQEGQHPHQVSLRMVNFNGLVSGCGGNVINKEWLLTAAHCTAGQITLVVRAGVVDMTRPEVMLETGEFYIYPTFDASRPTQVQPNDISLVKLPQALEYSRSIRPIRIQPLADANRNYDEEIVYASGFGRTWTNGLQSPTLRWVYLRGVTNAACASLFGTAFVTDTTVCARFFNVTSQSICQGDSGGPLVHVSGGVPYLIGISSFVAGLPFGCHSGLPAAFIRPGPFHSWLTEITGIDFNDVEEDTTTVPTTIPTTDAPSTTASTEAPSTTASTEAPSTTASTEAPSSTASTEAPSTTASTEAPSTTASTEAPSTTVSTQTPSTTPSSTTSTTAITPTVTPPTTPEEPDEEETDIDDPELSDLLKRLEVKVKVKVRLSKFSKRKNETKIIE